ncbi:MAG: GNAT family N-acetyltransferase [Verrucomicrobia bacterium]|nr:MAG: GNAT family N-acetyltransferase [Verrucomicrobiota bacterium]
MRLVMVRSHLEQIPEFGLPLGFSIRTFRPGDEEHWLRIHLAADKFNESSPELFVRAFGSDISRLGKRQLYLCDGLGAVVGTGTAWFDDDFEGARFGRVHYMAIMPEHQGRGLGKALMTAVCRRLGELGHDQTYLSTSSLRLPAIRLYRLFGFEPLIQSGEEGRVWAEVTASLRRDRS